MHFTPSLRTSLALCLLLAAPTLAVGDDHQARQLRPIQLGTSGGNVLDITNRFCCSGTLGALVSTGAGQCILSNNHVLARLNSGLVGDVITQPGLVDNTCLTTMSDQVATLTSFVALDFRDHRTNTMDAAIAAVTPGSVSAGGELLDIGQVSSTTLSSPAVGTAVKKSGRSTGVTTGTVTAVNATVTVGYPARCGSNSIKSGIFTGQLLFDPMSQAGDSGSLIVEDQLSCPRPVALLFAGSPSLTVGTPIDVVLTQFGATIVGCSYGAPAIQNMDLGVQHAIEVQKRMIDRFMDIPGIVGTAVGVEQSGRPTINVYLSSDDALVRGRIPAQFEDVPSRVIVSGPIVAQ